MFFSRRFLPYFVTQCLGALNDNVYKNVLLLLVAYSQVDLLPLEPHLFVNLAAGVFILPFFLFSAHAGDIADNMDKARLIRRLKMLELVIMALAAVAIVMQQYLFMLLLLFLTGTQSAYFGPVKYSLLPQALREEELVSGNALVEMGTFLAILIGTLSAGLLVASDGGRWLSALTVSAVALAGFVASRAIPSLPPQGPVRHVPFAPFAGMLHSIRRVKRVTPIWMAILAISWFWFLGVTYLTQFPNFAREYLHGDATVVSVLLALFSIGIALGSLLCERLSFGRVDLGVLPFGVAGLTLFGVDILFALPGLPAHQGLYGAAEFVAQADHWRLMFDLLMVGLSGGLYIVPLYAFIQSRAERRECARAIAANNIVNALFMVVSSLLSMLLLGVVGIGIPELFLLLALMNAVVAFYVYRQVPEFAQRFASYLLSHLMYRLTIRGREFIPSDGPALLVANHVSYVDALLLLGASTRPIRFVMDKTISEMLLLRYLFRHAGVIPICSPKQSEATYLSAFKLIDEALAAGQLVCIFPEGRLSPDGQLGEFRPGVETILARRPVPVVAMALVGLWGSYFSHEGGAALTTRPKRFWSKITIHIAPPVDGANCDRHCLRQRLADLLGES